jgi:copper chaperone CopZ
MKVISLLALALCCPALAQSAKPPVAQSTRQSTTTPFTLSLEGVDCVACEVSVQEKLEAIKGVAKVTVSAKEQRAVVWVRANKTVTEKTLRAAVVKAGYKVVKIQKGDIKPQAKSAM